MRLNRVEADCIMRGMKAQLGRAARLGVLGDRGGNMAEKAHAHQYDIVVRYLCDRYPLHGARLKFHDGVDSAVPLPTEELHVERREGDVLWRVRRRGKEFIEHMQFDS